MKSNYDRSKTIIRETTKNYHPRANDPPLLIIHRHIIIEALKRGWKATDFLGTIVRWKYALPHRLVYNFGCLSLKIVKLAFHWRRIFAFCDRDCVTEIPPRGNDLILSWYHVLIVYSFIKGYFSEIKTQNFRDDALLVEEIHAFIHFFNNWFKPVQTISPCPP